MKGKKRTVNFRLSSNVNLSLPQTAVTYLFFAVISRIKERQKRDMLGGAVLKRRFTIYSYMMNIICFTLQNLELCRKKKTEAMRNFFFNFFSFCYKTLSFSRFVRESFVRENFQKISAHRIPTFYSFLTNKHVMYLDYIPKLGQEVVKFAHKIFTSAMKLQLS